MTIILNLVTIIALLVAIMFLFTAGYYTRQTSRILDRLPEEPEPWYVRLTNYIEKIYEGGLNRLRHR